jgi:hypothetical protein
MSDKIPELQVEPVVPEINALVPDQPEGGIVQSVLKKISDNKMYIYIGVAVIVLGLVLYYFFIKNKKETTIQTDKNPQSALPNQDQPQETVPSKQPEVPSVFNPLGQEYYVLDNNGNPVKVSGSFPQMNQQLAPLPVPNQQPSQQEIIMIQKQMREKQMIEAQEMALARAQAKPKMKLEHPSNDENVHEESDNENDIDVELARIKANEDENVAEHNLTQSELAEINKKIEMMNSSIQ